MSAIDKHLTQIRKHLDAIHRIQKGKTKSTGAQIVAGRKGVAAIKQRSTAVKVVTPVKKKPVSNAPRKAPMCKKHGVPRKGHKCTDEPVKPE